MLWSVVLIAAAGFVGVPGAFAVRVVEEEAAAAPAAEVRTARDISGAVGLFDPVAAASVPSSKEYDFSGADLAAAATPLTMTAPSDDGTVRYRVQRGDTVSSLAARFGISSETIRWANPSVGRDIRPGTELTILPVSGVLYSVSAGDSLATVGERFHVDPEMVRRLNPGYQEVLANGAGSLILADAKPIAVAAKNRKK